MTDVGVVDFAAPRDDGDGGGAFAFCEGARGVRRPAAAEDDDVPSRKRDARVGEGEAHPEDVGVVAREFPAAVDDGVDRSAFLGGGVQLVKKWDDCDLVRDGDVDALEGALAEEGGESLGRDGVQLIVRRAESRVQAGGETVPERVADEPHSHCATS